MAGCGVRAPRSRWALAHAERHCEGESLVLLVNGTQVASAVDSEWADGNVGLLAGTYDTPGTEVTFDNFIVCAP